jgi:peptide/nickel transport system permease protein
MLLRDLMKILLIVLMVVGTWVWGGGIGGGAALTSGGRPPPPPVPSWGRMLRDAQTYIFQAPELALWPGLAVALAVLGLNMLGDGLRDLLDPRLRLMRVG